MVDAYQRGVQVQPLTESLQLMKSNPFNSNRTANDRTCGSDEHTVHRRLFLQGAMTAGAASTGSFSGLFSIPALGEVTRQTGKKCILLWLCGAPSQFETWDPKPGRLTGGPYQAIQTSLPGVQISELMPKYFNIKIILL